VTSKNNHIKTNNYLTINDLPMREPKPYGRFTEKI